MTPEQTDYLVALMSIAVATNVERVERLSSMTSALGERVERAIEQVERDRAELSAELERAESERDYAVAVADSLRARTEGLERELGEVLRRLANAPHAKP